MARVSQRDKDERLGAIIQAEISQAENWSEDAEGARRKAVDYYLTRPRGDEIENRSSAQSADVRDMIGSVLSNLLPMISQDSVVNFEPMGAEDEDQARAESDVLNRLIMEDNGGTMVLQAAIKDALLLRNGAVKCWAENRVTQRERDLSGLQDDEKMASAVQEMERAGPGAVPSIKGEKLIITRRWRKYCVGAVPIEYLIWSSGYGGLQDRRFFAEAMDLTRSELVARGVPRRLVDELGASLTQHRRDLRRDQRDDRQGNSRDQEKIACHECYLLIDEDGDGISERWRVLVANERTVLEKERVQLIPYALGTVFLNPHRLEGESLADHLLGIQDGKTFLLRQFMDNLLSCNNGKYVYDPARANEEDILNPIAGGGIRSRDPTAVVPLAIPDTTAGSLAGLTYMDQRRTEAGGASLDMMRADMQLAGETAWGTERQYASREQMVSMMALNLSETLLRGLYSMVHEFLRAYGDQPMQARLRGQYVQVDPRTWRERTRMNIVVGKTPGQRGAMQQALAMHMQMQAQAMAAGMDGILANAQTLHATARLWLSMAGIENPDALLLDPQSEQAQQAARDAQQAAQEQAAQQMQMIKAQLQLASRELDIKEADSSGKLAHAYFETESELAMKESELVTGAQIDLEKQRREALAAASQARAAAAEKPAGRSNAA